MKDIAKEIKSKIEKGDLKMKPKAYFVIGTFLASFGIIVFGSLSTFFANVMIHRIRVGKMLPAIKDLPLGFKFRMFAQMFPWEMLLFATLSLILGLFLIRKFDVAYKKSFTYLVSLLILIVVITAATLDKVGFNERFKQKPHFRRLYEQRDVMGTRDFKKMPPKHKTNFERNLHPRMY